MNQLIINVLYCKMYNLIKLMFVFEAIFWFHLWTSKNQGWYNESSTFLTCHRDFPTTSMQPTSLWSTHHHWQSWQACTHLAEAAESLWLWDESCSTWLYAKDSMSSSPSWPTIAMSPDFGIDTHRRHYREKCKIRKQEHLGCKLAHVWTHFPSLQCPEGAV